MLMYSKCKVLTSLMAIVGTTFICLGRMTEAYEHSPFRQFVSFYFSYIPVPSTTDQSFNQNTNFNEENNEERNDYRYHYYKSNQSDVKFHPPINLEASINDSCIFHTNSQASFFEQCDIYNTNLFCYPRHSIFSLDYSKCDCFSWENIKHDPKLVESIFQESEEDTKSLLMDLANFLSIEMEWNKGQCQSLNGSACSIQEPEILKATEIATDDISHVPYVQCTDGLKCQEVNEGDFVIGRCLPVSNV